jgi:hypothetical protein
MALSFQANLEPCLQILHAPIDPNQRPQNLVQRSRDAQAINVQVLIYWRRNVRVLPLLGIVNRRHSSSSSSSSWLRWPFTPSRAVDRSACVFMRSSELLPLHCHGEKGVQREG